MIFLKAYLPRERIESLEEGDELTNKPKEQVDIK